MAYKIKNVPRNRVEGWKQSLIRDIKSAKSFSELEHIEKKETKYLKEQKKDIKAENLNW